MTSQENLKMDPIEFRYHIDNIHDAVDRMRTAPRGTLGFSIVYIESELDALRDMIEAASYEKDCKEEALKEKNPCLSNCQ